MASNAFPMCLLFKNVEIYQENTTLQMIFPLKISQKDSSCTLVSLFYCSKGYLQSDQSVPKLIPLQITLTKCC